MQMSFVSSLLLNPICRIKMYLRPSVVVQKTAQEFIVQLLLQPSNLQQDPLNCGHERKAPCLSACLLNGPSFQKRTANMAAERAMSILLLALGTAMFAPVGYAAVCPTVETSPQQLSVRVGESVVWDMLLDDFPTNVELCARTGALTFSPASLTAVHGAQSVTMLAANNGTGGLYEVHIKVT